MSTQSKTGLDIGSLPRVGDLEDEGVVVELRDINDERLFWQDEKGNEKPVTITVAGSYSHRYRRTQEAQTTRVMKRRGGVQVTGEMLSRQRLELIASCVLGWEGFVAQGKAWPCTKENVMQALQAAPYIREQVEAAMEDHEAFFKRASGT